MADKGEWKGASWKQEEDFSKETAEILARINHKEVPVLLRSTTRPLSEHIGEILEWEKKARFGGDVQSARKLSVEIVRIYRVLGKVDEMMELIDVMMRKRAQSKTVQTAMIAEASIALGDGAIYAETTAPPEGSDAELELKATTDNNGQALKGDAYKDFLQSLRHQTEGKIHLELEHARFTFRLATLAVEVANNKREASDLLVGIQVETITNMPRLEKIQSVLFQLRLALDLGDDGRFIVLSRKLNPRALGKDDTHALKMQYFVTMASYYEKHNQYLAMARCWYEIFTVLNVSADAAPAAPKLPSAFLEFIMNNSASNNISNLTRSLTMTGAVSNAAVLCLLAPHTTKKELDDQQEFTAFAKSTAFENRLDLMNIFQKERVLETEVESVYKLLKTFLSQELIRVASTPLVAELSKHHSLLANFTDRREELSGRLSEHDLLVIAKFYSRAKIERLAELVGLSAERTESYIMSLVEAGELFARFDRVDGVLTFEQANKPSTLMGEWSKQVEQAASLVERASQLISKERMVQASIGAK